MKNKFLLILLGVVFLMGFYISYQKVLLKEDRVNESDIKGKIERLQNKSDSLIEVNKKQDVLLERYRIKLDSLNADFANRKNKIEQLKEKRNEKILFVDSLNSSELFRLFAGYHLNAR